MFFRRSPHLLWNDKTIENYWCVNIGDLSVGIDLFVKARKVPLNIWVKFSPFLYLGRGCYHLDDMVTFSVCSLDYRRNSICLSSQCFLQIDGAQWQDSVKTLRFLLQIVTYYFIKAAKWVIDSIIITWACQKEMSCTKSTI